jgi:hypothetical protein
LASPLIWKVYHGRLEAACRDAIQVVVIASYIGRDCNIKVDGKIVWREGNEVAGRIHDLGPIKVAEIITERAQQNRRKAYDKVHGAGAAQRVMEEKAHG